ncbi:MAG: hypothetical protein ACYCSO_04585 [Cuniculiplasma sp.]
MSSHKDLKREEVGVKIQEYNLKRLLDSEFVGLLEKELPEVQYVALMLYTKTKDGKPKDHMHFIHGSSDDFKNSILGVEGDDPKDLRIVLSILKKLKENEQQVG